MSSETLLVRTASTGSNDEIEQISALCRELGYAVDASAVAARLREANQSGASRVFVACTAAEGVVGWIQVSARSNLLSGSPAIIEGLNI